MDAPENGPSMLGVAAAIQEKRQQLGAESCLHIDTGDTIQGSLIAAYSRGAAPLALLRSMKCDAWIPGNHEFDFGPTRFLELAEEMRPWIICGNLQATDPKHREYPAWKLFNVNGAKIAVIGATASFLPNWYLHTFTQHIQVTTARSQLQRILPEVRQHRPDAIVLAIHQGWTQYPDPRRVNEVNDIAKEFPEIDLILGGHTHRGEAGRTIGNGVWYVQPPAHGKLFVHATIHCNLRRHEVQQITSKLVPASTTPLPDDHPVTTAIKPHQEACRSFAESVIAPPPKKSLSPLGKRPGEGNPISEILSAAIARKVNAPVAIHGVLSKFTIESHRAITGEDLFKLIPYENTIVTCKVTIPELEAILTEQWQLRKVYTYTGVYAAKVRIGKDGKAKVQSLHGHPTLPSSAQRVLLAMNSFTAAGGGRTPVLQSILKNPTAECTDTGISTRMALQEFLQGGFHISIEPQRWITPE